jgi:ABC-type dipeptide/oligopeptide/nickel transport system permease component
MLRYLANRFLIAIAAVFLLATITFFLLHLVPGDPLSAPRLSPEVKERLFVPSERTDREIRNLNRLFTRLKAGH